MSAEIDRICQTCGSRYVPQASSACSDYNPHLWDWEAKARHVVTCSVCNRDDRWTQCLWCQRRLSRFRGEDDA